MQPLPNFSQVTELDYYDGPLISVVEDETGRRFIACICDRDHHDWWRAFIVVPIPDGETNMNKVIAEATEAYLWDYGNKVLPWNEPLPLGNADRFLGAPFDIKAGWLDD